MDTVSPARRVVGEMRTGLHSMRPAARCWRLLDATTRMLREAWALTEKSLNVAAPADAGAALTAMGQQSSSAGMTVIELPL